MKTFILGTSTIDENLYHGDEPILGDVGLLIHGRSQTMKPSSWGRAKRWKLHHGDEHKRWKLSLGDWIWASSTNLRVPTRMSTAICPLDTPKWMLYWDYNNLTTKVSSKKYHYPKTASSYPKCVSKKVRMEEDGAQDADLNGTGSYCAPNITALNLVLWKKERIVGVG